MALMDLNKNDRTRLSRSVRKSEGQTEPPEWAQRFEGAGAMRVIRVDAATSIGTFKWRYTATIMKWNPDYDNGVGQSTGNWEVDGVQGAEEAYNLAEFNNTATACGNGVNPTNLPAGFTVKPAGVGQPLVWAMALPAHHSNGNQYSKWWFSHGNGVDGTCL